MKIALCLSGQIRNAISHAYPFIQKNILDGNDVDIFLHTWKSEGNIDASFYKSNALYKNEDIMDCLSLLNPKLFIIEESNIQWKIKNEQVKPKQRKNYQSQYYSMQKSFELKSQYENSRCIKYDFCIRSRYDFAINKKINFLDLDKTKLYCVDSPRHDNLDSNLHGAFNDQFWIASSDNCDSIAKLFEKHDYLYAKYNLPLDCGPEAPLYKLVVNDLNIDIKAIEGYEHPFLPNMSVGMASPNSIIRI